MHLSQRSVTRLARGCGSAYAAGECIVEATLNWPKSPPGLIRPCRAGCATSADSTPRSFRRSPARSMPLSFAGPLVNTSGSKDIPWPPGTGCARSNGATRPCLPTGAWDQRSDDGSRMNSRGSRPVLRERGAEIRRATRLPPRLCDSGRSQGRHWRLAGVYNTERQHQSLGYRTPRQIYREGLWYVDDRRCRPAALPPLPEPARKAGKCSPSPTYPPAPQSTKRLMLMNSKSRGVAPATAPTVIGADIETGRATP